MPYDPRQPHENRYLRDPPAYDDALLARVEGDARKLCQALGYDLNTVEFAVEEGVPYAIDFMNPAPDADCNSVGPENFEWIVDKVAKLAIAKAQSPQPQSAQFHWSRFLSGGGAAASAPDPGLNDVGKKAVAKKTAKKDAVK